MSEGQVHIGKVIRDALVFNFRNQPRGALLNAVDRLFALLEERRTDYLLVGEVALLQYVQGRNTDVIDLIMALSSRSFPRFARSVRSRISRAGISRVSGSISC